jgi:hypothetical protein
MFPKLLTSVVLILLFTAPAYSQNEVNPPIQSGATSSTLGSYLEPLFQSQLSLCITGNPGKTNLKIKRTFTEKTLSAVPPQLNDQSLKLGGTVLFMPDQSVARAFAYVYPAKSIPAPDATLRLNDYIVADYLENPRLLTAQGFPLAYYDHSCATSIAASLKANAGWTFPMADVSSALQNDLNSKNTYHLALVSGTMSSPLWEMYKSKESQDYKTYGQLLIWDWYSRHPDAVADTTKRYLLTQFNGVSVYKLTTNSFTDDGKVKATAGATLPVLKISGELEAAYKTSTEVKVESFGLVARQASAGNTFNFEDFPSVSTVAALLSASAKAHLDPSSDLRLGPATRHIQVLTGVPQAVCTSKWRVEKVNTTQGGKLDIPDTPKWEDAKDANSLPTCKFTVSYTLDAVAPGAQPPTQVNLDYYLVTELPDAAGTIKGTAKIKADTVSLSSSGEPTIQPPSAPGIANIAKSTVGDVNFYTFQWSINFTVSEDQKPSEKILSVQALPTDLKLTCGADRVISQLSGSLSYNTTNSLLSLSVSRMTNDSVERLDMSKSDPCTLSGRVTFTLKSGAQVQRDIPPFTYAGYQKLLPASAPSPSPAPSPAPSPTPPGL